jgi:hypothetical protein
MIGFLSWQIFFAGLWAQFLALSWPVLVIVVCVGLATFGPMIPVVGPFIPRMVRQLLIVVAALALAFLVGEVQGVQVCDAKWEARSAIVKKKVDDAVKSSPLGDPGWVDPNNDPNN